MRMTFQSMLVLAVLTLVALPMLRPADAAVIVPEGKLIAHWDFENETYDSDADTWTITDKSGAPNYDGVVATSKGSIVPIGDSDVLQLTGAGGVAYAINDSYLNSLDFNRGMVLKARFSLSASNPGTNYYIMAKSDGGANATLNLFVRDNFVRFTVADGTVFTSVLSGTIALNTTYSVIARFNPELGQIALTVDGGTFNNQTWTEAVSFASLYTSNTAPLNIGQGPFDGWIDDLQIIVVPEPGSLAAVGVIAAVVCGRRRRARH